MAGKKKSSKPKEDKEKDATAKNDKEEATSKKASSKKEKEVPVAKKPDEDNAAAEKEKVEAPAKKDEKPAAKKRKEEAPAPKDDDAPAKKGKVDAPAKTDEGTPGKNEEKAPAEKQEEPATNEQTKEEPPPPPSSSSELAPSDRDVILSQDKERDPSLLQKGNILLADLIRLHFLMSPIDKRAPKEEKDVEELATRLTHLMLHGKKYELAGLKDVPKPFLKGEGHFFEKKAKMWRRVSEEEAKAFVAKTILSDFKALAAEKSNDPEMNEEVSVLVQAHSSGANTESEDETTHAAPRPFDVLFLPVDFPVDDSMPYEHQTGNKHTLFLASQHVSSETDTSPRRMAAALKVVTSKVEISSGTELIQRRPRPIIQLLVDNQNSWQEMARLDLGEFAVIFVFEVYLEKQIHHLAGSAAASSSGGNISTNGDEAIILVENPTTFDVLFGRGGMTNGHHGNRRFRDIIALHRPDYIRASKMDKPNVARRIVRAIRQGNPPGRFLKKNEKGIWQDVGDRTAAEKTSQGLRERSNSEKRQRSALREALRIRREDLADSPAGENPSKKPKIADPSGMEQLGSVPGYIGVAPQAINYAGAIPLSLSMKEKPKEAKAKKPKAKGDTKETSSSNGDETGESLPPKAKDEDGNILVTDYDILCGRGGLTNHHKGNKRFRDIVALHRPDYVRAPKIQKPSVARVIVRAIRHGDPPGRFIRKDEKTGLWYDIGDKRAAEKTSQALREKTNEERDQPKSATPFTSPTAFLPTLAEAAGATSDAAAAGAAEKAEGKEEEAGKEESGETGTDKVDSDDKKKDGTEKSESEKPAGDETKANDIKKEENDGATEDGETAAVTKEGYEKKTEDDTQTVEV